MVGRYSRKWETGGFWGRLLLTRASCFSQRLNTRRGSPASHKQASHKGGLGISNPMFLRRKNSARAQRSERERAARRFQKGEHLEPPGASALASATASTRHRPVACLFLSAHAPLTTESPCERPVHAANTKRTPNVDRLHDRHDGRRLNSRTNSSSISRSLAKES